MSPDQFWQSLAAAEAKRRESKPMRPYVVAIGQRDKPRLCFEAVGPDACTVTEQHMGLMEAGDRIEVRPA